jgi:hypothetical protein
MALGASALEDAAGRTAFAVLRFKKKGPMVQPLFRIAE